MAGMNGHVKLEAPVEFWKKSLADIEPCYVTHLTTPNARLSQQRARAAVSTIDADAVTRFCTTRKTSVPVLLQTAWAAVLGRYIGTESVSFGNAIVHDGLVKASICRAEWTANTTTVGQVAQKLESDYSESLPYQHLPLSDIHTLTGTPTEQICDTMVLSRIVSRKPLGVKSSEQGWEKNLIIVDAAISQSTIEITLDYLTPDISVDQAQSLAGSLGKSLQEITVNTSLLISQLDLCSAFDREQLFAWNTGSPETISACMHTQFERRAAAQPDAPAAVGFGGFLTYRQLNDRATALATHLRNLGVGPEVYVPFAFDKSTITIIAMLAVLKAGGACVALNPSHPINRLQVILRKTDARVVLTDKAHSDMFAGIVDHVVAVTSELIDSLTSAGPLVNLAAPENPAFVVFTSGSTGEPKGIVLEHRALCTSAKNHGAAMRLNTRSRSLQFAAYTFDVSIGEIFTTLLHGGCVCVPSDEERMSDLAGAIQRLEVNWAYLTPTVASLLNPEDVPTLKTLSLGGEAVKQENITTWADHVYLINIYGPAETTIWSTGLVNLTQDTPATNLGIGLGALMWVTDPTNPNRLCPIGAVGEILIEGPILARGYLKDQEKTDAVFIDSPSWAKGTQRRRFYRSADLGYMNADGTLSFVGRRDNQVKMYGQRIEMGEIEFHLKKQCPNLQAGLVEMIKPKVQDGQPALAAFLSFDYKLQGANSDDDLTAPVTEELREVLINLKEALAQHLPSYMVPSLYIPLVRMPTSVSGKLDRRRLRDLAADFTREAMATYSLASLNKQAPTTPNEKILHGLLAEVLNVQPEVIGVEDSFFQLGGDSIAAMKLVTAARKSGLSLSVSKIFRRPVLADLAKEAEALAEEITIERFSLVKIPVDNLLSEIARDWKLQASDIEDIFPCTPLQEGLMAVTQNQSGTYTYQNVYSLPKDIDLARFRKAWELTVQTTDILRTTIVPTNSSGTFQLVTNRGIEWQVPSNVEEYLRADLEEPMQYGGPLARYAIVEGKQGSTFIWTAHHALYDGWSLPLTLRRVEDIYKAGKIPSDIQSIPFQRFISHLQNLDSAAVDAFWKTQLSGSTPPKFPHLPSVTYQPRVNQVLYYESNLPRPESAAITSSTLIRAAWSILMSQYSDAGDDVVFGVTTAGRNADVPGITEMIAPTITTVPVRVQIDSQGTVDAFLNKIQSQATDMIPFEHAGLQNIAKLNNECRMGCNFQNLLVVQPDDDESSTSSLGIKLTQAVELYTYALVVQCFLQGDKVKLQVDFDDQVLTSDQIERLCYQLEHILTQLSSAGIKKVSELNIFSGRDMAQVLEWNREFPYVESKTVPEIIVEQAAARPDAPAICSWDGDFTYQEVDQLSNRFARHLINHGVGPETLVPYCFPKSAWTIIAMLGITKAGGACVALDPGHPKDRLETIISDASAKLVVTTPEHAHLFDDLEPHAVTLGPAVLETLPADDSAFTPRAQSHNPVFVLFTSGSTGKPKGIVIEHGMFASSAAAHSVAFGIGPDSRVLQFAAYTFDVSVGDIFTSLMRGACICVPSDIERMNNIAGAINRMKVNYTFLTPTVANLLTPSQVPTLKRLTLGGEASTHENIRTWADDIDLIICYGPAECSVYCSANPPATRQSNPAILGHAVGALIWLVDPSDHNKLTPVGGVGELVVQGPTVARGYLNEPEKTKDSFIEDPAWLPASYPQKYRKIYKTGDLARYNADGTLSFVARKDTQVKVRGQRVELAEIEVHLSRSPEIKHALLAVPASGRYKGRLTCVLSFQELSQSAKNPSEVEIELVDPSQKAIAGERISTVSDRLTEKLPPYMIPAVWVVLKNIPLNASGKMNRKVVKGWVEEIDEATYRSIADIANTQTASEPTNEMEEKIQLAFSKTLNLPANQIGLNSSFLSLGGDSISAMQVMSRLRAENIRVTVQDILRYRTIEALATRAQYIEQDSNGSLNTKTEVVDELFDLAPIQRMFFDMQPNGQNHFNQSFVLKVARDISQDSLKRALETVIQCHSMLRSRFAKVDGVWRQKITNDVAGSYLLLPSQSLSREEMIAEFKNIQTMLNIEQGPIVAGETCSVNGSQYLFLTVHHLAVDLVSWRVILQDLEDVLVSGKIQSEPTVNFQLWSKLQQQYTIQNLSADTVLSVKAPRSDFAYWGMAGAKNVWGDISEASFTLDTDRTALLLGESQQALRTQPVEVMIAALMHSFRHIFSDRSVPAVFLEGHGREPWTANIDITQTVGWFTTMYPVSYETTEDEWLDAVKRTKDARRAIDNNGWPYFTARYLNPQAAQALGVVEPEVIFNYLGLYQQFQRSDALLQETDISGAECNEISPNMQRYSLFEITAGVEKGCLRFTFEFNKNMAHQSAISAWVKEAHDVLAKGVDLLVKQPETATLSDFPMLPLSYEGLTKLTKEILPGVGVKSLEQVESILPCSPMQLGLLMSQLKSSGDYEFYTILEATASKGIDAKKLLNSWQQVIDRHAALRTIFIQSLAFEGLYDQLVLKQMPARIEEIHSDDPISALKKTAVVKVTDGKAAHKLTVCHTSNGDVFCKLEVNHALIDGTSMATILRDIKRAYGEQLSSVPALPYSDYVAFLQEQKTQESVDYWKTYLQNIQPCQFPILDDGREQEHVLKSVDVELPNLKREALQAFSDRYGITLANVVQTAWALVLRTFTSTDSVCYGYLTSGRDAPLTGIEEAVGPFINMLVCRMDFQDSEPALNALQRMQEDFLHGMSNQYVSLAEIQSSLGMSGQRLFNTAMSFQRYSPDEPTELSLKAAYDYDPTEFDITVNVATLDGSIKIDLTYWTSKLSSGQAVNIANTYGAAISSLLEAPEELVSEVSLLGTHNKELIRQWNTNVPATVDRCIHDVISENARLRPHASALESWEASYTYEQMDKITNRLARALAKYKIQPDECIALCFEKSLYTIIAMIAVLKAGGAFVLLDPKHPNDRLKSLLEDINARFLISSPQTLARSQELINDIFVVSPSVLSSLPEDDSEVVTAVTPRNIMYVQFTSGSTGKPKGVVMEHASCSSSVNYHGRAMRYGPNARVYQFSSYTFDAIILEAFTTLYHGGCVCVPTEEDRMTRMADSMREMNINLIFMTPTLVRLFQPEDVPSLETLMLGGEPIAPDNIKTWKHRVNLIGGYGPAECCVYCCYSPLTDTNFRPEVIGYPVGSVIWIVDAEDHNKLLPVGAVGELIVQGPIVGRCYLNDKARSDASFISTPSWMKEYHSGEQSLYKTGDLARYNSDGTLTIIGRKDTQVKLNGQRIELGEIEHHIKSNYPNALHVAVDAIKPEHTPGRQLLSAFLDFGNAKNDDVLLPMTDELRATMFDIESTLSQALPPYMVPRLWFPLKMPMSSSGKTERKVLKQVCSTLPEEQLEQYALTAGGRKREVSTEMERRLQALWTKVLKAAQIGADDSFFRIGGDSIAAIGLSTAAQKEGLSLSVSDIFTHPRLCDMALVTSISSGSGVETAVLQPFSLVGGSDEASKIIQFAAQGLTGFDTSLVEDVYPCTPLQEGLMALTMKEPLAYIYRAAFKLPKSLDLDRFQDAWATVLRTNPILRTVIIPGDSGMLQAVLNEEIQWSSAATLTEYIENDEAKPILYGSRLSRYGFTLDGHFVWTAHHSVYDGWSFSLMLQKVQSVYEGSDVAEGTPFAKFIEFLTSQDKDASDNFWKAEFEGASALDFPQIPSASYQPQVDAVHVHTIDQINYNTQTDITPSTILSAAWGLTIGQLSNTKDVVFGMTRSGRNVNVSNVTEMMGPTITTLPVRIQFDPATSVEHLLQEVQNHATLSMPYEHAGLQHIRRLGTSCQVACDFKNIFVVQPPMISEEGVLGMENVDLPNKGLHTYALIVECILDSNGEVTLRFEYDSQVLPKYRVEWLASQFEHTIRQLSSVPSDVSVGQVDVFSPEDEVLLRRWNASPYHEISSCVHHLISKNTYARPSALALNATDGSTFTYAELEKATDALALYLSTKGVQRGDVVPISFSKSVWVIVSMIAVNKLGAAFVGLEPSMPAERVKLIIDEVEARYIITSPDTTKLFTQGVLAQIACDKTEVSEAFVRTLQVPANFVAQGTPTDLMYMIFTSGSTGRPKGVLIEHRNVSSSCIHHGKAMGFTTETRNFFFAALTFDATILDIFTTLLHGGCVCVPSDEERNGDWAGAMKALNVNTAFMTPTMARLLRPEDVPSLELLMLGGEAVGRDNVEAFAHKVRLMSGYGPTETTIFCQYSHLTPGCVPENIGYAVGCLGWVTMADDHNRLAPIGSIGELVVQGPILGRGYFKDPEKTASAFIENPAWFEKFGQTGRIYKTGDLVQYTQDGTINFIGRKDTQVKLHGQRIELGEIDHNLWAQPEVRQSTVMLPRAGYCKDRIVAVMSLEEISSQIAEPQDLKLLSGDMKKLASKQIAKIRDVLAEKLPSYMIPTIIVAVERLPQSIASKTDIRLIKEWINDIDEKTYHEVLNLTQVTGRTAPANDTEKLIQEIYARILNLPLNQVALDRSFVSLGGDSITAMQVMSRLRAVGMAVNVKDILRCKSVPELAASATIATGQFIQAEEKVDVLFDLSPVQSLFLTQDVQSSQANHFNQSFILSIKSQPSDTDLQNAFGKVTARHSMLRARFERNSEGQWKQKIVSQVEGSYSYATHTVSSDAELESIIAARQRSLDIESGPLFGGDLILRDGQKPILFLVAHHLVIDMVSWRVVMEDFEVCLSSKMLSTTKPFPFQRWTELQAEHAQKNLQNTEKNVPFSVSAPDVEYWGMENVQNVYGDTKTVTFDVTPQLTEKLLTGCHGALNTETMDIILSSLVHSFGSVFEDRALPNIYTEGHGREPWDNRIDLSSTVGWFTTIYPVTATGLKGLDVIDIVKHVKDDRRKIPQNGWPYFTSNVLQSAGARSDFPVEIIFNYFGSFQQLDREDALLQAANLSLSDVTSDLGADISRFALFEISAEIVRGSLHFTFMFNRAVKHQELISQWIKTCQSSLEGILNQLTAMAPAKTLADFPLLTMDYAELDELLQQKLAAIGIPDANVLQDIYPCSPMQEGLLLAQNKFTDSYQTYIIWEVTAKNDGVVDVNKLAAAWQTVIDRHQPLRTVFMQGTGTGNVFLQAVFRELKRVPVVIESDDEFGAERLRLDPPAAYEESEPCHRLMLCRTPSGRVFCRLDIHHALFDGASIGVMCDELSATYEGGLLSEAPMFSDYISYLQSQSHDSALGYWKEYLGGLEPCLFPNINEDAKGLRQLHSLEVEVDNFAEIQSFCLDRGLTMSNVLLTAWGLLLRNYTGTDDVSFGYLTQGRDIPVTGVESAVGPFINMLVSRVKFAEDSHLQETLEKMQSDFANSLSYQHCSLAEIHHALNLSGKPLFNSTLSLQYDAPEDENAKALTFHSLGGHDPTEYDISVNMGVSDRYVRIRFVYWSSALSVDQAKLLGDDFLAAVNALVQQPDAPLATVNFTGDATKAQLRAWNYSRPQSVRECVHELFMRTAAENPDSQAICSVEGDYTYAHLNEITSRFANYLRTQGVGAEVLVPVCFSKSPWTIISMISILKAGGACVPLDPSHPRDRIEGIVDNCKSTLILCQPKHAQKLAGIVEKVIEVDQTLIDSLPNNFTPPSNVVGPDNAAFVVFTSGSTGKPKGIILEHKGLCTMFTANAPVVEIGPGTRTFQYAAYTFDVSIAETYITLTHGGCVCVPTDEERMNDVVGAINRMKANWTFLTPSVAALLQPADVPTLRTLTLGGEAISRDLHSRWSGCVRLINSYGPAECSIWTSNKQLLPENSPADIGAGITCLLWVTEPDNHDRLVPIGCVGELVVQGPNLARGYLNDKEKTDAAYIENPAWLLDDTSGMPRRVYKTGDLVRHRSDGNLEFVGRKDTQVKFHGQRVEIGEVEYQLRTRLEATTQVVVEMIKPVSQNSRQILAAFISLEDDGKSVFNPAAEDATALLKEPSEEFKGVIQRLESSVSQTLPVYMIPTLYIRMTKIPRNTSMKIDRKTLRLLGADLSIEHINTYSFVSGQKRAPETAMEKRVHQLWMDILHLPADSIGADDSFFRIGGDSIAAMQLVAAARKDDIFLSVADIFQNAKLSDMATIAILAGDDSAAAIPVEPFSLLKQSNFDDFISTAAKKANISTDIVQDIYPSTPLQEGLMSLTIRDGGLYTLQALFSLPPSVDVERFQSAWEEVVEDLDILRTRLTDFEHLGAYQVVAYPGTGQIHWKYADNLQKYLQEDKKVAFGYGTPLARYAIVQELSKTYFVWSAHHAVYDGWSMGLMIELLARRYLGQKTAPATPFNRFIQWRSQIDRAVSRDYWTTRFSGSTAPEFPRLPRGHRPRATGAAAHSITLASKPNSEITLPTVIRAAWAMTVGQHTGSEDVVFGMTQTGRNAPVAGVTEMIAPLITTVPVRVDVAKQKSISSLLQEIQKDSIAMIPHEHAGLQYISRMSPECAAASKFQNLLVIQSQQDSAALPLGLGRLPVEDLDIPAFGIVLECEVSDGKILVNAGYDPQVVSATQIETLLWQFDHIFQQISSQQSGSKMIQDLQLVGEHDLEQLNSWNYSREHRIERLAHEMIRERALAQPNCLAIDSAEGQFTYGQLDDLSTRLAHHIKSLGVGPDVVVPLMFRKTAWAIVSSLAVMKSGAAFVFLDPKHPMDRLNYIIQQINASFVVTTPDLTNTWEGVLDTVVITESFLNSLPTYKQPPATKVTPRNILYVIFTSGSTGRPKGCVIEHSSFLTAAVHHVSASRMSPTTRVLQMAPFTFDVSILETVTSLLSGACICLTREQHQNLQVSDIINDLGITWTFLTPSMARTLNPADVPTLEVLILGGEALSKVDIEMWADQLHLINGYGPSECSVATASNTNLTSDTDPMNIGHTMGCNVWVVDADDHNILLPIGAVGELLVEGAILARGYLNEPEKTDAAFIRDPAWLKLFDANLHSRFYKTGDLVKMNDDGTIHFVGRKDTQVKLRGQRIELGEIEHHTSVYPAVKHAMIALPRGGRYKESLVAVLALWQLASSGHSADLVPASGEGLETVTNILPHIRRNLTSRLPPYMVPTTFIVLDELPLLPSGKIDRSKIKTWLETMPNETHELVAAQSGNLASHATQEIDAHDTLALTISDKITQLLAGGDDAYAETLRGRDIGLANAGLNSISVISLTTYIKDEFGVKLAVESLMDSSVTVVDVARMIENAKEDPESNASSGLDVLAEFEQAMSEFDGQAASEVKTLPSSTRRPETVLLTGATGFLGSQILRQLLELAHIRTVVALVRGRDRQHALDRVISSAKTGKWWQDSYASRLDVWVGDLSKAELGLGNAEWASIEGRPSAPLKIDAIVHNGAVVHWGADYAGLKAANVSSTISLLAALTRSPAPPSLTFVSGGHVSFDEADDTETAKMLSHATGYAQSKFVADLVIKEFAKRYSTTLATIVKPGLVIGTAESGVSNTDDFFWRVVASIVDIKAYNTAEPNAMILLAGAQQVASLVLRNALEVALSYPIETNMRHGVLAHELWSILSHEFGYNLQALEPEVWLETLKTDVRVKGDQHRLWPVLHFLEASGGRLGGEMPEHMHENEHKEEVKASLRQSIEYMRRIGYLAPRDGEIVQAVEEQIVFGRSGTKNL